MAEVLLRAARAAEAGLLSELALRSKAHLGYDTEFLDACRAELTLSPAEVVAGRVVVAEVAGFYTVDGAPPDGELGNLWVDPDAIGTGLGRRLWEHAVGTARDAGSARCVSRLIHTPRGST